jgi:single-strand DNA-binding protein
MTCKVIMIGNMGRDPEIKSTANGKKFARFSIGIGKYANKQKSTMWMDIVVWNEKLAEVIESFAAKGTKVYVEGTLERREYTKDGATKVAYEVHVPAYNGDIQLLSRAEGETKAEEPAAIDDSMPF